MDRTTWNKLIRLCKRKYGLKKVIWAKDADMSNMGALCTYEEGIVKFNIKHCRKDLNYRISALFHEMGHIHCHTNGLWRNYHFTGDDEYLTARECELVVRTALKAERWVDKWAEKESQKELKKLGIKFEFVKSYRTNESKKRFHKYVLDNYKGLVS